MNYRHLTAGDWAFALGAAPQPERYRLSQQRSIWLGPVISAFKDPAMFEIFCAIKCLSQMDQTERPMVELRSSFFTAIRMDTCHYLRFHCPFRFSGEEMFFTTTDFCTPCCMPMRKVRNQPKKAQGMGMAALNRPMMP
jgi:hypothetical protein